jgi:hypothetical protein
LLEKGGFMRKIGFFAGITLLCFQVLFASSATVSLKGTVKTSAGKAISGAKVALAKIKSLTATTDTAGAFTMSGTVSAHMNPTSNPQFQLSLTGNTLLISPISSTTTGSVDVFSNMGKQISSIQFSGTKAGTQSVNLPKFVSGLNIIRVTIGGETITRTLVCLGNSGAYLKSGATSVMENDNFSLAKVEAAVTIDTLIVTKSGFVDKKMPLTSYNMADLTITLDTVVPITCTLAALPANSALTVNKKLPSPFKFFDGTEMTRKDQWPCRRQEILNMACKYMYGPMPPFAAPDVELTGKVSTSGVTANITYKGKTATLNFSTTGSGSILLIEMSSGGITPPQAHRTYTIDNSVLDGWKSTCKTLFNITPCGEISAGWGCNILCRAIAADPSGGIDTNKIMTTGCSNTAKTAFLAAAYCEGIKLTVVVESGGFGDASFRVAEYLYNDKQGWKCSDAPQGVWMPDQGSQWLAGPYMDPTTANWLVNTHANIYKLPYDQHSLVACIAPRAACMLTNQNGQSGSGEWCHLNGTGSAISYWAAEPVWNALGVPDNFGGRMYTETDKAPGHCSNPKSATDLANEFFKRVFDGDKTAKTDVLDGAVDAHLQQPHAQWESTWAEGDMLTKTLQ